VVFIMAVLFPMCTRSGVGENASMNSEMFVTFIDPNVELTKASVPFMRVSIMSVAP